MPDNTIKTEDLFERGLAVRREVLGAEYVDGSLKAANNFMMAFQEITTAWCWGYAWARPTLDRRARSMLHLAMLATHGESVEGGQHGEIEHRSRAAIEG